VSRVALTFDNGPEPAVTPVVLDCLARFHLNATFFVLGEKAAKPEGGELVRRASAEGHRIGSHTWSHRTSLGNLSAAEALAEFERGAEVVEDLGVTERLFRPPGGGRIGPHLLHPAVIPELQAGRYTCVLWNLVTRDWRDPDGWQERGLAGIRELDWTLLVLHDLPNGAMLHLEAFLREVLDEGHTFTAEFPPSCLPIVNGRVMQPLDPYVEGLIPHKAK